MKRHRLLPSDRRAFTLAEMLIAVSIFTMVIAFATTFFVDSYRTLFKSQTALEANRSSRSFLGYLSEDGREADSFAIYPSYSGSLSSANRIPTGNSGDFIVLAETELSTLETKYIRLIGYYTRAREQDEYFDIISFEYDVPGSKQTDSLESLVNAAVAASNTRLVFTQIKRIGNDGMFINVDGGNIFSFHGIRVRFPEQAQPSKIMHATIGVRS